MYSYKEYESDISAFLDTNILWLLENDYYQGCVKLADLFNKQIIVRFYVHSFGKIENGMVQNYSSCAGAVGYSDYTRGSHTEVFYPTKNINELFADPSNDISFLNLDNADGLELLIDPTNNYLKQCEYNKRPRSPCATCFANDGRTTWLKGSGNKSSQKTKGSKKNHAKDAYIYNDSTNITQIW
jgi:hypothetical protein